LEPSWDKKPPKPDVKTNQKNNRFLEGLWIDFWSILGSMLEGLGRFFCGFSVVFLASCWLPGPGWLQDLSKKASGPILNDFWSIFERFLLDFLIDFWSIFLDSDPQDAN